MTANTIKSGDTLKHYRLEKLLGKGGMGVVYRARDSRLDRWVAIKLLHPKLAGESGLKPRFLREARAAAAVSHPAIAQIYEIDERGGTTYIVMEYVEGQTLDSLIAKGELDLLSALELILQVAEGLSKAHQQKIVHRDIKPANIMVTPDGHAKVLDFGLAKLLEGAPAEPDADPAAGGTEVLHQTTAGTVLGTLSYMSPEQTRGQPLGPPSDIFSLGVVLYETLTGRLPFNGESPVDTMHAIVYEEIKPATLIRQDLPPEIHRIIATCLRKMPRDRYPDAVQLVRDLKRLKQDVESGVVRKVSPFHHLQIQLGRFRDLIPSLPLPVLIIGVTAVLVALTLIIGVKWEGLIPWAIVGLLVFRYVKNRKKRLIKKFIARIRKFPEVKVVTLKGERIRVYARNAQARLYVKINSLVDDINRKLVFGQPMEVSIETDLTRAQLAPVLKESGVLFVRDEVLRGA